MLECEEYYGVYLCLKGRGVNGGLNGICMMLT